VIFQCSSDFRLAGYLNGFVLTEQVNKVIFSLALLEVLSGHLERPNGLWLRWFVNQIASLHIIHEVDGAEQAFGGKNVKSLLSCSED